MLCIYCLRNNSSFFFFFFILVGYSVIKLHVLEAVHRYSITKLVEDYFKNPLLMSALIISCCYLFLMRQKTALKKTKINTFSMTNLYNLLTG